MDIPDHLTDVLQTSNPEGWLEAPTTKFKVSNNDLATIFVFCDDDDDGNDKLLGGINFPYAGVHFNPQQGSILIAVHRKLHNPIYDDYVQEYHMCPHHHIYSHTLKESKP